ncbi:MAG: DUF819 family protein [Saprospiraceae bacterium]|nr:DUF819 family protein [Saprospiraceae bacterium]
METSYTPFFTNDAVTFGLLMVVLALIFYTSSLKSPGWSRFYKFVPALLLCYFVPALLNWPLGLIAPDWYEPGLVEHLRTLGHMVPEGLSALELKAWIEQHEIASDVLKPFQGHSSLYFVASRYLLPASLVLLCLSIDMKGVLNLGPKALIMFFAATIGIVLGGPIALLIVTNLFPNLIDISPDELWRGLSTVAGSWIGGGANQTAMKEIFEVGDTLFGTMIIVDVVVANIWMGFLLYGASISDKLDRRLKADNSAIEDLKERVLNYSASVKRIPDTNSMFILLAVAFGAVALSHWGADVITPFMEQHAEWLIRTRLTSLMSGFFWLIVIATSIGLLISFTKLRKLEGVGASRWGSVFIYILVATIGMKMNLGEVWENLSLFAIGIIWMAVHVTILLFVAWLIKAPFFFVAVGSQANVGGAASAPIVASAFSPALAPVGVLMAVLGYALGTYMALVCAYLMQGVVG